MIGTILAGLGGGAFSAIGFGALIAPGISSVQYGLPTTDRTALAFVRALGARDLVLGLAILLLLAARNRRAVESVLALSVIAALGDAVAVRYGSDRMGGRRVGVHLGGAAALLLAWQTLRSGR